MPPLTIAQWRHDLSGEIDALAKATSAARHMLEGGNMSAALADLGRVEVSSRRCINLLHDAPRR